MKTSQALKFILITVLLESIGIGLVIPIVPDLLSHLITDQANQAYYYGLFISLYAAMQFIASPFLGALSDRFGRRPVLLASLAGAGLDYLILAFAPNLVWLFIGRIIAGMTGAGMTVASAYVADIADESNRAKGFGYIGAAFGLGFIVGPALGGVVGDIDPRYPFFVASLFNLLNFAYGYFVLPESLPKEKRRLIQLKKLNPLHSLSWALKIPSLLPLFAVYSIYQVAGQFINATWAIYTGHKYGWSLTTIGLSFSFFGLSMALSQAFLTGPVTQRIGLYKTLLLGLSMEVISYSFLGWAPFGWMAFAICIPMSMANIAGPAMQSLVSNKVSPEHQGEIQGTLVSVMSLTAIIGPLIGSAIYSETSNPDKTNYAPGFVYVVGSALCLISVMLAWRWRKIISIGDVK